MMSDSFRDFQQPPTGSERPKPKQDEAQNAEPNALDQEIDRALDQAAGQEPAPDVNLKRDWDDELEAELEQALEGFDPEAAAAGSTPQRPPSAGASGAPTPGSSNARLGRVVRIRKEEVIVDLGAKSEGFVPMRQFEGKPLPNEGDTLEVFVEKFDPTAGLTRLNLKGATLSADWSSVQRGMVVEARVTKAIKGGLEVEVGGMRGFLPVGQIEIGYVAEPETYVGQRFPVAVTEANPREKNLVVSRRELLERERAELREKTWAELEEGQTRQGTVRSIKDFGAFVDLGGVDGLIHVSDLSWSRSVKPEEVVRVGDEVEVKVLKIDREKDRVGLGLKQLTPSPWDTVETEFRRGQVVAGRVTRTVEFGAFVEVAPGIEGLIHISELAPGRVRSVNQVVQQGQEVEARILDIDAEAQRMSLTLKPAPTDAPEAEEESEDADAEAKPKKVRKTPLKGGLGDSDPNPFGRGSV